ncbi:MAG: PD-(D/E)XK nuclease family transposase, partial [Lachnospiraceae bacterium]|nr:PD-(D/E)XK nuclease family transposase [Lachnospiraceae bacterium]
MSPEEAIEELRDEYIHQLDVVEKERKKLLAMMKKLSKAELDVVVPSDRAIEASRKMGPMDDVFFNKLGESDGAIEEVISTVLGMPIIVREVVPQYTIAEMGSRGVRLDSFATIVPQAHVVVELEEECFLGPKGSFVNIEVQMQNNDDFEYRVYYNGASIIVNNTPKGTKKFADIPRAVVIFISAFDVFEEGEMYYEVQKSIKKSGTPRRSPVTEIYINTQYEDASDERMKKITDLMKLFKDPDAYDFDSFPKFSQRKKDLRTTEKGVLEVASEFQQIIDDEKEASREEGREEGRKE